MSETKKSHKLWGGRFSVPTADALDALNRSINIDFRLWPHDIRLSKSWAVALWGAGVLTLEESKAIESGLDAVAARLATGVTPDESDEDIHTLIDRLLSATSPPSCTPDAAVTTRSPRPRGSGRWMRARTWTAPYVISKA